MTENRFTIKNERTLVDNRRGKKYVFSWASDAKEVCYLLNQFNDYDELLKREKECYKSRWKNQLKANGRLEEENEQLKKEKQELQTKANEFVELYEKDFGKKVYSTPPRSGKTVRLQLWIVRKILDELGILEMYGDCDD